MLIRPLSSEKTIRLIDTENKIVFILDRKASKKDIKDYVEKKFNVKVKKINTLITPQGKKKAYITLEEPAIDLATKLGLM